jgi:hypothetical protein
VRRSKQRLTDLTVRNLKPRGARRQVQAADGKGDGRRPPGQPAPISANRLAALISRLFTFALDREVIDTNPAYRLPRAKDRVRTSCGSA